MIVLVKMTLELDHGQEVVRLEAEARAKAAKHVANMLARPDQLEKVGSFLCKLVSAHAQLAL